MRFYNRNPNSVDLMTNRNTIMKLSPRFLEPIANDKFSMPSALDHTNPFFKHAVSDANGESQYLLLGIAESGNAFYYDGKQLHMVPNVGNDMKSACYVGKVEGKRTILGLFPGNEIRRYWFDDIFPASLKQFDGPDQ